MKRPAAATSPLDATRTPGSGSTTSASGAAQPALQHASSSTVRTQILGGTAAKRARPTTHKKGSQSSVPLPATTETTAQRRATAKRAASESAANGVPQRSNSGASQPAGGLTHPGEGALGPTLTKLKQEVMALQRLPRQIKNPVGAGPIEENKLARQLQKAQIGSRSAS